MYLNKIIFSNHYKIGDFMYFSLIFKTIFMYFFIIFVYRLMGKKEVGQLSIVDLIVSILIAELIALSIQSSEQSIFVSVVPILVLVFVQIFISFITLKSDKVRYMLDGKPTLIIKNGKVNFTEMSHLRYSLDDLLTQLRLQGIKSINKVKFAVLETNGNLSVFTDDDDYPLPLILDGIINYNTLKEIGKNYNWLIKILKKQHMELGDIFYAFYTSKKVFIIKKTELF